MVGLAPAATSQSSLARLEVRASLAAAVLEAWNRDQESALQHRCTKEVAESAGMVTSLHLQGVTSVGPRSLFSMPRVTARESSADEGSRAETELKCILQWLDEGVILFDAQENVRTLNSRFLQVAGLDSSDAAKLPTLDDLISTLSPFVADPGVSRNAGATWRVELTAASAKSWSFCIPPRGSCSACRGRFWALAGGDWAEWKFTAI